MKGQESRSRDPLENARLGDHCSSTRRELRNAKKALLHWIVMSEKARRECLGNLRDAPKLPQETEGRKAELEGVKAS